MQFGTEDPDETQPGRAIDLTAGPCGAILIIEGQSYTEDDMLLPIECKRLPTPKEKGRDEREYVVTLVGPKGGMRGGIQRFKFGRHGAKHRVAGMIGYVQEQTFKHWLTRINGWITDLAKETDSGWSDRDTLRETKDAPITEVYRLHSRHGRPGDLENIELRHLWIEMERGRSAPREGV